MRLRVHQIVELDDEGDRFSRLFDIFILSLILINVVALVLQTEDQVYAWSPLFFDTLEMVSVGVFTLEYGMRIWSCVELSNYSHPIGGRVRFMLTPMALIDLLAILPFYMVTLGPDLRMMRSFRLFRLFRIAKIGRYLPAMQLMLKAVRRRTEELVVSILVILILLIVSSSLMYYVEREAQPEAFASIPRAMWWGVATLTTVGYGDVYPVTALGRVLGAVIAVLGVGLFALPTGLISGGFLDELQHQRKQTEEPMACPPVCPHCGEDY